MLKSDVNVFLTGFKFGFSLGLSCFLSATVLGVEQKIFLESRTTRSISTPRKKTRIKQRKFSLSYEKQNTTQKLFETS